MRFRLEFSMNNDSFCLTSGHTGHVQSGIVLNELAKRLPVNAEPGQCWKLRDENGNAIGMAEVLEDER